MRFLPEPGERVAHFRVIRKIGQGGMGAVFEAQDELLDRRVALKVLPPEFAVNPSRRARFFREARAAAAVQSRSIATVHEVGDDEGRIYIAMELVRGESLRQRLRRGRPTLDEALRMAREIAAALGRAHAAGVVHRDLKPDNVMLDEANEVKLLDFGLAASMQHGAEGSGKLPELTMAGEVLGTPGYMSPEQAQAGNVDARSDWFSFGALLYELLSGRRAFSGDTLPKLLIATLEEEPPPVSELRGDVPPAVVGLVRHCLAKDPTARVASADEVIAVLDRALAAIADEADATTVAVPGGPSAPSLEPQRDARSAEPTLPARASAPGRRSVGRYAGVAVALSLLGAAGYWLSRPSRPTALGPASSVSAGGVLSDGQAVVACPLLEEAAPGLPAGWLSAAAASAVCTDLALVLGGEAARTRIPAELLELPRTVTDDFPDDPFGQPDARARSLAAAKRHTAWIEGRVRHAAQRFELSVQLHAAAGPVGEAVVVARDTLHEVVAAAVDSWIDGKHVSVRPPSPSSIATAGCSELPCLRKNAFLEQVLTTSWDLEPTCDDLARNGANARWLAGFQCGPVEKPPPLKDVDSPLFVALDSLNRLAKLSREDVASRADVLKKTRQMEPAASSITTLTEAMLRIASGDQAQARALADSLIEREPRSCDARAVAVEAASGRPDKQRLVYAEGAWCPWRARAVVERHWDAGSSSALPFARLALVLSSDAPRFAPLLAYQLLIAGRREEARTVSSRFLSGSGSRHETGSYMLALVEAEEGRIAAATQRLRESLMARRHLPASGSTWELELLSALLFAEVQGKDEELAAEVVRRFVLPRPPVVAGGTLFVALAHAALRAPRPLALEGLARIRELLDDGTLIGKGMGAEEYLDGCEAYVRRDLAGAAARWRPLAGVPSYYFSLRPEAFDAAAEPELAWRIDDYRVTRAHRTELAQVRQALRAEKRGDFARARQLARHVVDRWSTADTEVTHVKRMRELLARLEQRSKRPP